MNLNINYFISNCGFDFHLFQYNSIIKNTIKCINNSLHKGEMLGIAKLSKPQIIAVLGFNPFTVFSVKSRIMLFYVAHFQLCR
jgi:hypothetical protein